MSSLVQFKLVNDIVFLNSLNDMFWYISNVWYWAIDSSECCSALLSMCCTLSTLEISDNYSQFYAFYGVLFESSCCCLTFQLLCSSDRVSRILCFIGAVLWDFQFWCNLILWITFVSYVNTCLFGSACVWFLLSAMCLLIY